MWIGDRSPCAARPLALSWHCVSSPDALRSAVAVDGDQHPLCTTAQRVRPAQRDSPGKTSYAPTLNCRAGAAASQEAGRKTEWSSGRYQAPQSAVAVQLGAWRRLLGRMQLIARGNRTLSRI